MEPETETVLMVLLNLLWMMLNLSGAAIEEERVSLNFSMILRPSVELSADSNLGLTESLLPLLLFLL